ncbi:MerR family transcriptional regulator [Micromonospora chalcea]|uniref:hypothetical protein n=1 Tax=Micromonospora chalcea TaxID=1874 RepID=UPI0038F70D73
MSDNTPTPATTMTNVDPSELLKKPTLSIVEAGIVLGLGRSGAYECARRGEIPTIKMGRRLLVPTAKLKAMLGMDEAA